MDFNPYFAELHNSAALVAMKYVPTQAHAAVADADAFVSGARPDLQQWMDRLARHELPPEEFEFLVQQRAALFKASQLLVAGVSTVRIEEFWTTFILSLINNALEFVQEKPGKLETSAGDDDFKLGVTIREQDDAHPATKDPPTPTPAGGKKNGESGHTVRAEPRWKLRVRASHGRMVSTGFAGVKTPGDPCPLDQPLAVRTPYYYWLEIGEPVVGAADTTPLPSPQVVPSGAELTVALFAPEGGFVAADGVGRLRLQPNGTARVLAQPAKDYPNVPHDLFARRLLFPITTSEKAGRYRLRSGIYCRGVLVQSRLTEVYIGAAPPPPEPAVRVDVDYTLSANLPATLNGLEPHTLSIMVNDNGLGSHDFYFFGSGHGATVHRPVTISAPTLNAAITRARQALREVSWGNAKEWTTAQKYRYATPGNVARLREDLINLAGRGFDVYNLVVANLAATGTREQLETLLKAPGTLQVAGKQDLRFVLPAAMIYDYKIDNQLALAAYTLCSVFERAYLDKTPLLETPCFQGACPSRGKVSAVCPSGFWGFRHAIGLPMSLGKTDGEVDLTVRFQDVPVIVVGVSTDPDLKERKSHQAAIQGLKSAWQKTGWFLGESRQAVLDLLAKRQPHLVYLYCHGGVTDQKEFYLSLGAPGKESYVLPSNLDAYVSWYQPPHPLVFINGCHTTALDANTTLEFVTEFVQVLQACGVIGTEITVFESLAGAFATSFWRQFLAEGVPVGEAIRGARLELLQSGNPLGLVYTPFVLAGTRLEKVG